MSGRPKSETRESASALTDRALPAAARPSVEEGAPQHRRGAARGAGAESRAERVDSHAARARLAPHLIELGEGAWLAYLGGLFPDHEALAARIAATSPLRAETLRIAAREVATPRLTAWHGDPGRIYAYSGRRFVPAPWTEPLAEVRDRLEALIGVRFDSVLVNAYRGGRDSMGWHADDEPELGPRAPDDVLIASVSLGAPRRFVMRHRQRAERRELALGEGDLLVMGGTTQRRWQHAIPKTARPVGPRTNLTFRLVRPAR